MGGLEGGLMKKLLLATSALMCAAPALGADIPARMPVKAPAAVVPVAYNWTGCYLGGHAGYGWGRKDFSDPTGANFAPPGATVQDRTRGWLAGGQVGCNYQLSGSWLIGIEGEYAWANIKGDTIDPFFAGKNAPNVLSAKTDGLASATGRVGFVWDRALFYAKGGAAWAHDRYNVFLAPGIFAPAVNASGTETRFGWTVGGGIEWGGHRQLVREGRIRPLPIRHAKDRSARSRLTRHRYRRTSSSASTRSRSASTTVSGPGADSAGLTGRARLRELSVAAWPRKAAAAIVSRARSAGRRDRRRGYS